MQAGTEEYSYFVHYIVPTVTGEYSIEVLDESALDNNPEWGPDTVLYIYTGSFDKDNPLTNVLAGNDDKDAANDKYLSRLQGVTLEAGTTYVLVMTTFNVGSTGTVWFEVEGPGMVEESETPPAELNPPTLTATGTNPTFTENGSAVALFSDVNADTGDAGQTFTGLTLTVTNVRADDELTIGGTTVALVDGAAGALASNGNYAVSVATGTATLTLTSMTRSNADIASLVDGMTYRNTGANPGNASRVVTLTGITDSGSNSNTTALNIVSSVTVVPVNDPPSVTGLPATLTFTEDTEGNFNLSGVTVTDPDSSTITVTFEATSGIWTPFIEGDIALIGSGTSTLAVSGTPANVHTYLNTFISTFTTLRYTPALNLNGTNVAQVKVLVEDSDGSGAIEAGTITLDVTAVNDPPVFSDDAVLPAIPEDTANPAGETIATLFGALFSDIDGNALAGIAVAGNAPYALGQESTTGKWEYSVDNGATWYPIGNVSNTSALLLNASTRIRFLPVADYNGTPGALTVHAVDDSTPTNFTTAPPTRMLANLSSGSTRFSTAGVALTTSVTPVNDAPSLTAAALDPLFLEGGAAVTLFKEVTAATNDSDQHFAALALTVSNVEDGESEVLTIGAGTVPLVTGSVGNVNVLVSGGTATVTVNGLNLDAAGMKTLVEGLAYRNTATPPTGTMRVVTLTGVQDDGGTANGGVDSTVLALASTVTFDLAPTVTGTAIPADKTYKTGDTLDFTVTYSENVTVTGTPYLPLTLDSGSVQASYVSGTGTPTLTFRYTVLAGHEDTDGIAVTDAITLNGGTIRDSVGSNAQLTGLGFAATTGVRIDGVAPGVASIERHVPVASATNAASVTYRVTFSEAVSGVDASDFTATTVSGNAAGTVSSVNQVNASVYDVTVNDITGTGSLRLDLNASGTGIVDSVSNALGGGFSSGETYTIDRDAPATTSVTVPASGVYSAGQNLEFLVNWSEDVTYSGQPKLVLTIGSETRHAVPDPSDNDNDNRLMFRYVVQAGDLDIDGITVASLSFADGSVMDIAGNTASTTLNSVGDASGVLVDAVAPGIAGRTVPAAGTYKAGDQLDFTVTYSEEVVVTGTPYIEVNLDTGGTVNAVYNAAESTATKLTFRYTVVAGNEDTDGIAVTDAIALNGGAIEDGAGNSAATTGIGFGSTAAVLVDGVAPAVTSIVRQTPANDTTNAASVTFRVTFTEAVTGVDAGDFTLEKTGTANGSIAAVSGSGSQYEVTVTDVTGNGTLRLDLVAAASIDDAAGNGAVDAFTSGESYTIDTTAPALPAANIVVDNRADPHKVVLTFTKALDADTIGAANAWSLTGLAGSPIYRIASVAFDGTSAVTLILGSADFADAATRITNADAALHLVVTPPATLKDTVGNAYMAGTVTESGATHLLDTTAPALSAISLTPATATTATLDVTASEKAQVYWIAVEAGATAPDPSQVIAAANYADATVVASDNGVLAAGAGSLALTNLPPLGDHDMHVVAIDAAGNLATSIVSTTWTPPTAAPVATTGAASSPGQTSATLNGTVDDEGLATTVTFEYGTTNAYGTSVAATTGGTIAAGTGSTAVSVAIGGLACNTTYHFRVVATNAAGTTHGNDATFMTSACAAPAPAPAPEPTAPEANPFNPGGTQTQTNLDPEAGIVPTRAPANIVRNLNNLDNRVGVSDNGVVVVLDNALREPVKFIDNPPDNVLIAMPSQKPVDVELNGNTLNIHVDPETPEPPQQTILATATLQLPDRSTTKGVQLVQGEARIGTDTPNAAIGGLELSKGATLRAVVVASGPQGGAAGFTKAADGSGSISAEEGEITLTVTLKGSSTQPGEPAAPTETLTITLHAGEVARFNELGELEGVYLGSLSGTVGKTGDPLALEKPESVMTYPAATVLLDGSDVPEILGMPFIDYLNAQPHGLHFEQLPNGLVKASFPGGEYHAMAVGGIEVVTGAPNGAVTNPDGSLSLTYGGVRFTVQPMVPDANDVAEYFARTGGYTTEVLDDGRVQISNAATPNAFFVARPRHALLPPVDDEQGLTPSADGNGLYYTNARGTQQLDPAFHDQAQVAAAAAAQGWTLVRSGLGGNNLVVTAPDGTEYQVVPDFRVEVLDPDPGLRGVIRQEGNRLYIYYADEPLRQGFTLK